MEVVQHRPDPGFVQLGFRVQVDASGVAEAVRLVDGLAQDGQGRRPLRGRVAQERQLAAQPVTVGGGSIRAAEMPRQERAHQLQAASLESLAGRGAGAEVSGRSQLRAHVADAQHPVEHLIRGRHPGIVLDDLVHAERAGRTRDGQCGGHDPVLRSPGAIMGSCVPSPRAPDGRSTRDGPVGSRRPPRRVRPTSCRSRARPPTGRSR